MVSADRVAGDSTPFWLSAAVALALFVTFFVTKLFNYIDVPIITCVLVVIVALPLVAKQTIDESVQFFFIFLCLLACYALMVSVLHSAQEIIFAFKFLRTLLLFALLYFVWLAINQQFSYERFLKLFAPMVVVHSLIVIACISSVEVREFVYSITGYSPRGPGWSRSPGLTVSYNTPSILHVLGLWIVASRAYWPMLVRVGFGLIILVSFIFMGRTIAFLGILLILFYLLLLSKRYLRSALVLTAMVAAFFVLRDDELLRLWFSEELYSSIRHFVEPIQNIGSAGGVDAYFGETLLSHLYFSTDPSTLLFGNGLAGHIGLIDAVGETQSDLGVINSINANGLPVTAALYIFYLLMLWETRDGDWKTVSIVVILSLLLSFKETGFFTSHATPVLFFLYFYNKRVTAAREQPPTLAEPQAT